MGRRKKNVSDSNLQTENQVSKKDLKSKNTTDKSNIDSNVDSNINSNTKLENLNKSKNEDIVSVPVKKKKR